MVPGWCGSRLPAPAAHQSLVEGDAALGGILSKARGATCGHCRVELCHSGAACVVAPRGWRTVHHAGSSCLGRCSMAGGGLYRPVMLRGAGPASGPSRLPRLRVPLMSRRRPGLRRVAAPVDHRWRCPCRFLTAARRVVFAGGDSAALRRRSRPANAFVPTTAKGKGIRNDRLLAPLTCPATWLSVPSRAASDSPQAMTTIEPSEGG